MSETQGVQFEELITRADEDTLSILLGSGATRLLSYIDQSMLQPTKLRHLVRQLYSPYSLLSQPDRRTALLNLLRHDEAITLCNALGLSSTNPFNALAYANITTGSANELRLIEFLSIDLPQAEDAPPPPNEKKVDPEYGLFEHQRKVVVQTNEILSSAKPRVILHMPTGSGKTRTALRVICDHLLSSEPCLVIWLAHSEELCEQTAKEFEKAWSKLGNRTVDVYRFWGDHNLAAQDIDDGIVIAGLAKAFSAAKRNSVLVTRLADRASLICMDEAHQAVANTYQLLLELLIEKHRDTGLLGLTATPGRTWNDISEDSRLAQFFFEQKVSMTIKGYSNPVDYLVDSGYLARVIFDSLTYHGGQEIGDADRRLLESSIDVPDTILQSLAEDDQRNLLILTRLETLLRTHKRILVFAATVDHSNLLATVLKARGHDAYSITGGTPRLERERLIRRYLQQSDDARVICNFGVLTTGFDAPATSAALIARPTKSLVLYSQMIGRAMRGPRAGGNESAEIVTVVDRSLPGFSDMGAAFTNWEDVWNDNK